MAETITVEQPEASVSVCIYSCLCLWTCLLYTCVCVYVCFVATVLLCEQDCACVLVYFCLCLCLCPSLLCVNVTCVCLCVSEVDSAVITEFCCRDLFPLLNFFMMISG